MNPIKLEINKKYGTQERFAIAAEINETIVSKIIRGVKRPSEDQRQTFARLLEIPADQLFGE
jgi:hypothetical protein